MQSSVNVFVTSTVPDSFRIMTTYVRMNVARCHHHLLSKGNSARSKKMYSVYVFVMILVCIRPI